MYECVGNDGTTAPEIARLIMDEPHVGYSGSAIDVWAFGCLFVFLMTGFPPFLIERDMTKEDMLVKVYEG